MRRLDSRGDTIVEVLIAILVMSVILTGAFVSARRSQAGIRQSQERVEALKVAEAQLERIRYKARTGTGAELYTAPHTFCVDIAMFKHTVTGVQPLQSDSFSPSVYPIGCQAEPSGVQFYSHVTLDTATNTFTSITRWDGFGNIGKQEVRLSVRIDP